MLAEGWGRQDTEGDSSSSRTLGRSLASVASFFFQQTKLAWAGGTGGRALPWAGLG